MKPDRTWYLVMNTHRARILRGLPPRGEPDRPEISVISKGLHLRAAMGEGRGRGLASAAGGRRWALEPGSDPQREDEREFLAEVAALLEASRERGEVEALVIYAAPDALGLWREHAPDALRGLVRTESDLNLVRLSAHRLVEAIRAHEQG